MSKKQNFQWEHMTTGVCYYPEHWPESMWSEDLERMREAGISTVRVAEFAWSILEPKEGVFCFEFFDRFLDICLEKEMKVIMGTPTATPPVWLTEKYPEVLNADRNGVLLRHGCRRHYNYNSQVYQRACCTIAEQMSSHYGHHPAVCGWQIDNELNCETDEFNSDADQKAFRCFLKEKYGTLGNLNEAWGAVFWNQTYTDWEQIYGPRPVVNGGYNPHQMLDYYRFISESVNHFCKMQSDIVRKYKKPEDFVTTNGLFRNMDNHRLHKESLDVYTYDSYPSFAFGLDRAPRISTDLNDRKWTRNLIETRSVCSHFGIMEQQSGANGWTNRMEGPAPRPGQLTLWAMQSVAQGADFISFFRWRTCSFGTEMYWHGILDYDNRDNRKLAEVKDFCQKFRSIDAVCGAENVAVFALLKDYDNEWAAQTDIWHARVKNFSEKEIFVASELNHTPYDIVYVEDTIQLAELEKYPVLFYPHPVLMNECREEVLRAYVEQGGILIIGCRAGYKDMKGQCPMVAQPGLFQQLTGTDIHDFTFTSPNEDDTFADWNGQRIETPVFNDIITPLNGTKVLAVYGNAYYKGEAALTEKKLGKGRTIHFGSTFTREAVSILMEYSGIIEPFTDVLVAPETVQVVKRRKVGKEYLFVLNYQNTQQTIILKKKVELLYNGQSVIGEQVLEPYGTAVYQI